jgi:hypothetical protein
MSKYNTIPLKEHKARLFHICFCCGNKIKPGEKVYYQTDKFLQPLSNKKFCEECFKREGQHLLNTKKYPKRGLTQKTLSDLSNE